MLTNWPLQTTPALPEGGTAPSPFSLLVLLVGGALAIQFGTDIDLRDYVPSFGSGTGDPAGGRAGSGGGIFGEFVGFLTSGIGLAVGLLTLLAAGIVGGALDVPSGTAVPFIVGLELLATVLILSYWDALNFELLLLVVIPTTILGLSALGEPIIGALAQSPAFPILAIGALYLGWQAVQAWRAEKTTVVRVRGSVDDDEEDDN